MSSDLKLTPVFPPEIKPVHVGEYCASLEADPDPAIRRWWDGTTWSLAYYAHESKQAQASSMAAIADDVYQSKVYWRGLRSKAKA